MKIYNVYVFDFEVILPANIWDRFMVILPVFLIVKTSPQFSSNSMFEIMTKTLLLRPGRTRQWHSAPAGYSPGKFGDSSIPRPSFV